MFPGSVRALFYFSPTRYVCTLFWHLFWGIPRTHTRRCVGANDVGPGQHLRERLFSALVFMSHLLVWPCIALCYGILHSGVRTEWVGKGAAPGACSCCHATHVWVAHGQTCYSATRACPSAGVPRRVVLGWQLLMEILDV